MPRDLYDCTASELATHSIEHLDRDTSPSDAAAWLNENGYDAAPVYADGDPVGFVHKNDITNSDKGETLSDSLTPLTIDYMISGDTPFTDLLSALIEKPLYFLGGHSHVTGILTRADLNTPPARIYLFDRITYLEQHLRELILDKKPDWRNSPVTTDELEGIDDRYEDAQAANVALNELHYAQFSTLETIVSSVKACWQVCGFSTKGSAGSRLHEVTQLRNDVAHANLLVENTDSNEFLSSGRTTENLYDTLETIEQVLTSLQEAGYAPETAEPQNPE
ncbi:MULTISPECIES: CBS domain-containing protein [Haloarcula]|uniref:CBS domain containing protein n=1 Tax=Haloarcula marismortui ATCC 33799 TaxID=662475 RepID=M0JXP8_9EURY|nr:MULTISPECIES: CBS domain-containing protein [Haloarcula]EMA13218.1 CBS domain containing protein [Haloarcula californiae ATCC 33799]